MHSNIFQISDKPISKDEYADSSTYYDNSGDFADYIGDAYEGKVRQEKIENFADIIKDVFTYNGDDEFVYKGEDAMREFKQEWIGNIVTMVGNLTPDNLFKNMSLYRIGQLIQNTHLEASSRVDIEGWAGGTANPFGELFEYAESQMKKGDSFYIGAVIDYHF